MHLRRDLALLRDMADVRMDGTEEDQLLQRLHTYLVELSARRKATKPLRCKLGFHKDELQPGTAGWGRYCSLCNVVWDTRWHVV